MLAAVYGPRQALARKEDAEQAVVEVVFKPRSGLQGRCKTRYCNGAAARASPWRRRGPSCLAVWTATLTAGVRVEDGAGRHEATDRHRLAPRWPCSSPDHALHLCHVLTAAPLSRALPTP